MKLKSNSLPISPGATVFLWTSILPLSLPCRPERGALPDPPFSCSSSVQRKLIWGSRLDRGTEEEERSTGSFSIFLHVTVLRKMAYIFLLWSIKIIRYTSKGMSLKKGSGSCGLFNQLLTTCGSILDENRIAFSSNSSPEFYFSQYSGSIIRPAPRTKGFTFVCDIKTYYFPLTNMEPLLFLTGLKINRPLYLKTTIILLKVRGEGE